MRIAILSNTTKSYSTTRLKEAAKKQGHTPRILQSAHFSLYVEQGSPNMLYRGKALPRPAAVIPRIAASTSFAGRAILRQFEQMGVFCLNSSYATAIAHDKLRTLQILSRHSIGLPKSAFVFSKGDVARALDSLGSAPVIIKLLQGTHGAGVMMAESKKLAEAIMDGLQAVNQSVLMQEFVTESRGVDVRAFVVGDRVIAAIRRKAKDDEFRSNVHLGAETETVQLDPEYERTAVRAAHIVGLRIAGVDLLESAEGPKIMEVNSSPGLEGIETTTGIDIAGAIIEYLEEQIQFPDFDIRQRLSLGRGYGLIDIPVTKKSELNSKAIGDTELGELEIQVLSISRGGLTLPCPSNSEKILPGDILLCFGKELTLKSLIPPRLRRTLNKAKAAKGPLEQLLVSEGEVGEEASHD